MLANSKFPLTIVTGDFDVVDDVIKTNALDTYEEEFINHEEAMFEDLEGDFIWVAIEASL